MRQLTEEDIRECLRFAAVSAMEEGSLPEWRCQSDQVF